jgi:diguanylate cyclase (GGDEF)-like protein
MGGDEFLVICPDTSLAAALACAERVRDSVAAARIGVGSLDLQVTVSIGVAVQDAEMDNIALLVKRADQGLYIAKDRGRNRVATFTNAD